VLRTVLRRLDLAVVDGEAVREHQEVAGAEIRLYGFAEQRGLAHVRREHDDDVRLPDGVGHVEDAQAVPLRLRPGLAAGVEADPDVDAGVAKVLRVGVPLAAVSDDRDPVLEAARTVLVVVDPDVHPCIVQIEPPCSARGLASRRGCLSDSSC
jgi:hypothetical protein